MSIIDKIFNKTSLPPNTATNIYTLYDLANSGEIITVDRALKVPAFNACVQVISESVGMLPLKLHYNYKGKTKIAYNMNEYKVLQNNANDYMTADMFRQNMTAAYILYGNAFAEKEVALDGSILKLHYINPERVTEIYIDKSNQIRYVVDGKHFGRDKIFHVSGLVFDKCGYKGKSILENANTILGLALAQLNFESAYFANNATPSTLVLTKGEMSTQARENFLKTWNSRYKGSRNQSKTGILPEGIADIKTIGSDAEKAQLLSARKESVIEIARLFRMPPHLIQALDKATFSNIIEQAQEFINYTLNPHLIRWEQACNSQLIQDRNKDFYFYKFNLDSLTKGKILERYQAHAMAINSGWKTRNEVREIEDMDRGGEELDEFIRLGNLIDNEKKENKTQNKRGRKPKDIGDNNG